jgi:hypothetical protein
VEAVVTRSMVTEAVQIIHQDLGLPYNPNLSLAVRQALEAAIALIPEPIGPIVQERLTHVVVNVRGVLGVESYRLQIDGPPARHGAVVDSLQVTERMP